MPDETPDVRIPEDEDAVLELLREDECDELTDQQKNLAIAQAKLIGDL